jgi:hypothetical protein
MNILGGRRPELLGANAFGDIDGNTGGSKLSASMSRKHRTAAESTERAG